MIFHFDHNFNWLQTIPAFTGKQGGYDKFNAIMDVMGGFMGGDMVMPLYDRQRAKRILRDHYLVWGEQGRDVYGGQITAPPDNQGDQYFVQFDGVVNLWGKRQPGNISWGAGRASDAMIALVGLYGPGPLLSTGTQFITNPTSYVAAAYTFSKQRTEDIINHYNAFEGFEWGGDIVGQSKRTAFYYRAPDLTTQHYIIDSRSLSEPLDLKPDTTKYGNKVRVYYDAATGGAGYVDVTGTDTATDTIYVGAVPYARNIHWAPDIDISGATGSTAAEATLVGQRFLNSLKVDGVETEPMNAEITLDDSTRIRSVNGAARYPFWMRPGCNVYVEGANDTPDRLLHIQRVNWKPSERKVTLSVNQVDKLANMLARLNKAA